MRIVSEDNDWETYDVERDEDNGDYYDPSLNRFRIYGDRAVRIYDHMETSDYFRVE